MKEPQAKGNNFRSLMATSRRVYGPAVVAQALALLPPALAKSLERDTIITGNWYPLAHLRAFNHALVQASGGGVEVIRELARTSTLDDFRGIYRVFTFVLSPEFLMRRTPGIWKRYYDSGVVSVEARANFAEARFSQCSGFDRILWQGVIGGCEAVLEACGAKQIDVTIKSGGGDEDHLTMTATWR